MKKSVIGKLLLVFVMLFGVLISLSLISAGADTPPDSNSTVMYPIQFCNVDSDCGTSGTIIYMCQGKDVMKHWPVYRCEKLWFQWKMCTYEIKVDYVKTCAYDEICEMGQCKKKQISPTPTPITPPGGIPIQIINPGMLPSLSSQGIIFIMIAIVAVLLLIYFVFFKKWKKKVKRR